MPSIAQIQRRNKRENLEQLKRATFEATVARLVEAGQVDPAAPMVERVHKVLLANRPFASPLPEPVNPRDDRRDEPGAGVDVCPICKGRGHYIGVNQDTGHVGPMRCECGDQTQPAAPLYDLLIATRKAAKFSGTIQSNDGRIVRIKKAGQDWQEPKSTWRLSDPAIIERLAAYTLIDQVATATEIWHRYRKIGA